MLNLTLKMMQDLERKTQILFLSIAVWCHPRLVLPKAIWQVAGLFPLIARNWRQSYQTIPAGMASNMNVSEWSPGLQLDLVKSLLDFLLFALISSQLQWNQVAIQLNVLSTFLILQLEP